MRRLAVTVAVISFFGLAIVGSLCGVPPFVCGIRAAVGAVVVMIMVTIVGRVFISIMVDAIIKNSPGNRNSAERTSESGN